MSLRTIVIGGGLSGLTAAHALARRGDEVVLFEESDQPGGVVRSERQDGFLLELGPNTVRPCPALWELIDELSLADEVLLADALSPRFVDHAGQLQEVPMSPAALLRTRLLSLSGKWRLLTEPVRKRGADPEESVRDFVARRLGPEVADRLIEPMVAGIFAGSSARLSVAAAFPTLARWERDHGSLLAGALADRRGARTPGRVRPKGLLSFRDGLQALPRALARALGPACRTATAVRAIAPRGGGWSVDAGGVEHGADRVILALPARRAGDLIAAFAPEAARALSDIPQPPLAVLHLAWPLSAVRRSLAGFGHLVAPSPDRRILGAVWSSSLFAGRCPADHVLLTVFLGGTRDPEALKLNDGGLVAAATRDLSAEGLIAGPPVPLRVTRWALAIPQYERGHARRMAILAEAEKRLPGLQLVGNYRGGVSVSDVIQSARAAATLS